MKWKLSASLGDFLYFEATKGEYSATIFQCTYHLNRKLEGTVYHQDKVIFDQLFSNLDSAKRAVEYFIDNQIIMSVEKPVSPFWTIRKQIVTMQTDEDIKATGQVFIKAVSEQIITREEEAMLEQLYAAYSARILKRPQVSTSLPPGHSSWFAILKSAEHLGEVEQVKILENRLAWEKEFQEVKEFTYDLDFIKARAMEEVLNFLPSDTDEAGSITRAIRDGFAFQTTNDHCPESLQDKVEKMYQFYAKHRIGY